MPVKRLKLLKFVMHPCICQRTLFSVLSREKPFPVGPSLRTADPSPKNKIFLSPRFFF